MNVAKCLECNNPVTAGFKFCDRKCAAIFNQRRNKVIVLCVVCGQQRANGNKDCCSRKCKYEKLYNDYITRWIKGEETGLSTNGKELSRPVRRFCMERSGGKCERCEWAEKNADGVVPVQLHHIHGFYRNRPEDLMVLCPNCHSLTPNFGAKNKGNGRKHRYAGIT